MLRFAWFSLVLSACDGGGFGIMGAELEAGDTTAPTGAATDDRGDDRLSAFDALTLAEMEDLRVTVPPGGFVGLRWDRFFDTKPELRGRAVMADGSRGRWRPITITWNTGEAYNGRFDPEDGAVEVEITGTMGLLRHLMVEAIAPFDEDPSTEGADVDRGGETEAGGRAPADVARPRSEWGARSTNCGRPTHNPQYITLHHTVTPINDNLSPAARIQQIQAYHIDTNGWCDIGYHFIVSQDGQIWQVEDETRVAAHVGNHNTGNVGVALLGDFTNAEPSQAQLDGAARITQWVAGTYGIATDTAHVKGHRDWPGAATACPGNRFHAILDQVRSAAGGNAPAPQAMGLCPDGNGKIFCGRCADPLSLESEYIAGVTTCENGGAGPEALKAQAVAARSYLHYAISTSGYIHDSQQGQVYSCNAGPSGNARQAALDTAGKVLTNGNGDVLAAFYVAGATPDPPTCIADGGDPDPTSTEWAVTYQTLDNSGGGLASPLGWLANPINRGCMSQWGARCLEGTGRSWEDILAFYYDYDSIENRSLGCGDEIDGGANGGGGNNGGGNNGGGGGGGGRCPLGNGVYCGRPVGLDPNLLYQCTNGVFNAIETCQNGCKEMPDGTADVCETAPPATCPNGDGVYCGATVGRDPNTLYQCRQGSYSELESCAYGCSPQAAGTADTCASPPPSCPEGDGLYCGDAVGQDARSLYQCTRGTNTPVQSCTEVCETLDGDDACGTGRPDPGTDAGATDADSGGWTTDPNPSSDFGWDSAAVWGSDSATPGSSDSGGAGAWDTAAPSDATSWTDLIDSATSPTDGAWDTAVSDSPTWGGSDSPSGSWDTSSFDSAQWGFDSAQGGSDSASWGSDSPAGGGWDTSPASDAWGDSGTFDTSYYDSITYDTAFWASDRDTSAWDSF
jgi:hypothetical protein